MSSKRLKSKSRKEEPKHPRRKKQPQHEEEDEVLVEDDQDIEEPGDDQEYVDEEFIMLEAEASSSAPSKKTTAAKQVAAAPPQRLHSTYAVAHKLEALYTGGAIDSCASAEHPEWAAVICGASVHIVDVQTGAIERVLDCNSSALTLAVEKRSCALLAVSTSNGQIQTWNLSLGKNIRTWKSAAPVTALAFDATGTLLASGTSVGLVNVWDVQGGFGTHSFRGHTGVVSALLFPRKGSQLELYSAGEDGQIRVWDLLKSSCRFVLEEHLSMVTGLAQGFLDEERLVSVGRDKVINMWSLKLGKHIHTIPTYEEIESLCLLPSKTKEFVITGSMAGSLKIWDPSTSKCVRQSGASESGDPSSCQQPEEPISRVLLWGDRSHGTQLLMAKGTTLSINDAKSLKSTRMLAGNLDQVLDVRFLDPSSSLVAAVTNDRFLRVFHPQTVSFKLFSGHTDRVLCIAVNPSFRLLATGGKDHAIRIWMIAPSLQPAAPPSSAIPDNLLTCIATCVGHTDGVAALAFPRKDPKWFASAGADRALKIWKIEAMRADGTCSIRCRKTVLAHEKEVNAVSFAPNDRMLATCSHDKTVRLWNFPELTPISTLKGHKRAVWNVAFSPVDQVLASASGDMTIRLWSLSSYSCIKTLEGHGNSVLRVFFVAHGLQLLSASADGLIKLWTVKNSECVGTFDGHADKVWALDVSKDEMQLVSGGEDSRINLWENRSTQLSIARAAEEEERIQSEQQLSNSILLKQYGRALKLALKLEKPRQALQVFQSMMDADTDSGATLDLIVVSLEPSALHLLLKYIAAWNTNSKNAVLAQRVLHSILSQHTAESLVAIIGKSPFHHLIEGLLPYTHRHYSRAATMIQRSHLIDLMLTDLETYHPTSEKMH